MSRLFISHSSKNDDWAIALKDWLEREGWSGPHDIFLDLDPQRGIAAGERWLHALEDAATRCEAVLFLVSEDWLASKWCDDEFHLASNLNKKLFALVIGDTALERLPRGLTAQWQIVSLKGEPAERFVAVHPYTRQQWPVHIAEAGLKSLKRGLDKAGISAGTFELQPDQNGSFGWRAPYRGLEALEPEDAAVFFGRNADIVRGIDMLRGLAARKPPRLLVILGASGAGKSSFLRAGLWPRLLRDDSQWLPLRTIRAGRGGAIEGSEGLLAALVDACHRFGLRTTRADLRDRLATPDLFVTVLADLRQAAAKRALVAAPPYPLPVLCLDQGEEVFTGGTAPESERFLALVRAAIDADAALFLVSIRSDSYGAMQGAKALAGIDQVPLPLGPVPQGEIAHIVREPAEILRRKAGPAAPLFDEAVIARLEQEVEGEQDALPLLAFVLQRLMREHQGSPVIGVEALGRTGGVAAAIESAAEAALDDAGIARDRARQRDTLRRLFIPRLARIDRNNKTAQRRVARQSEVPTDLLPLARALTERRLLVVKLSAQLHDSGGASAATLEVAHEALLRRWPTLAELLSEDRDALLLLDGVLSAAADWDKAEAARKKDFLAHHGSRLADAQALGGRGTDWKREIAPARAYLDACWKSEAITRRRARRVQAVIFMMLVAIIAGLVGWINQSQIAEQWRWYTVTRPFMISNVQPYLRIAAQEQALKPKDFIKECPEDKDYCPKMIVIPNDSFMMGAPENSKPENLNKYYGVARPPHRVVIPKPFAVSIAEVTFDEWDTCAKVGPCRQDVYDSGFEPRGQRPVINITWNDAKEYAAWLSKMTGKTYRLLTEAEYEYATRAGTTSVYPWGTDESKLDGKAMANCSGCGSEWGNLRTMPVHSFPPNAFGLYDMVGNVWEWVEDCYHPGFEVKSPQGTIRPPTDGSAWITPDCDFRVVRGGSWNNEPIDIASFMRSREIWTERRSFVGFRVARTLLTP